MTEKTGNAKKVLITGSTGFLGRYLLKFSPVNYLILAQYRSRKPQNYGRAVLPIRIDFLGDDLRLIEAREPDIIIHTAAMSSIDDCEVKPDIANRLNYEVPKKLTDFAVRCNIRLIFLSSDIIFNGKNRRFSERDVPDPLNVYSRTKLDSENHILSSHSNSVIIRPGLFYGLALNGRRSFTEIMLKNLYEGKQVFLFEDQYRTPVFINNLATAIWELVESDFTGLIHLAGSQRLTRFEMGEKLCHMFRLDKNLLVPVKLDQARLVARRPQDCSLDNTLSRSFLKTTFVDCEAGFNLAYR